MNTRWISTDNTNEWFTPLMIFKSSLYSVLSDLHKNKGNDQGKRHYERLGRQCLSNIKKIEFDFRSDSFFSNLNYSSNLGIINILKYLKASINL